MNIIAYNRSAAVAYACRFAFERNPKYGDFSNLGGNCTNFISQCLVAGGMPMNYNYPFGWFYVNMNSRSPSFTGVQYLYNFLTRDRASRGPFATEVEIAEVECGDIIQLSFDGETFGHTLLVVQTCGDDPKVATNTYDAFCRPLSTYDYVKARALHILGAHR